MALFVFRDRPDALLQVHIYLSWEICQCRPALHSVHRLLSPLCYWTLPDYTDYTSDPVCLSGEQKIRFCWSFDSSPLSLGCSTPKTTTLTYNYDPVNCIWWRSVGFYEPCFSTYKNCSARVLSLLEMAPLSTPKVLKGCQLQGTAVISELRARDNTSQRCCTPMSRFSP